MPPENEPLATAGDLRDGWGPWKVPFLVLVVGAIVAGVVLRFVTQSPLWLDESLSVNIARLPLGDIPEALRHDGHPPLYYVLLHGWMDLFGTGNGAVRAFSGVWALALFPLTWVAGRRLGGPRVATYAVAVLALSPYAVRYGTETRMYAMVMVLSLAGWLLVDDALRRPAPGRLAAIAGVVGLLLWTHYWAIWFLGAAGIALLVRAWRARRDGRADDLAAVAKVVGAFVAGGLTFLPWLPSMLYQGAHTGTPWARPVRPTEMITFTLADLGGGPQAEAQLLGWAVALCALTGLAGRAVDTHRIEVDVRTHERGRPFAVLIAGTLAIATVTGYALDATYASRYAAVFVPYLLLLAALGLDQVRSRALAFGALAGLLVFGGVGAARNVVFERSDADRSAAAIVGAAQPGDWVVYCPDQLGPSTSRVLGEADVEQVTYPTFAAPQRVDWTDYTDVLAEHDPESFAEELLERVGDHQVFLVYSTSYTTHEEICPELFNAIGRRRPPEVLTQTSEAYEPASVVRFAPVPEP